jgi:hypothetical protein
MLSTCVNGEGMSSYDRVGVNVVSLEDITIH